MRQAVYVSYILAAPGFVNREFEEAFSEGVPPTTPLIVGSSAPPSAGSASSGRAPRPGPECLQGEVVQGFNLVVYSGGSVGELDVCARNRDITAVYALRDGDWVTYILGAPDFVNREFVEAFPEGLPPITPLVARSQSQPAAGASGE